MLERIKKFMGTAVGPYAVVFLVCVALGLSLGALKRFGINLIPSSFAFLDGRASFDIGQTLIAYSPDDTYWRAILAGFLNTIYVALLCIAIATVLGLFISLGRLSKNVLLAKLCSLYVEIFRNVPLLLVILLFYFLFLSVLPSVKTSYSWGEMFFLNQRGFYFPRLGGLGAFLLTLAALLILTYYLVRLYFDKMRDWFVPLSLGVAILLSFLYLYVAKIDVPRLGSFNIQGGNRWTPEFLALCLGLSLYSAAFCAEIIRGGIVSVNQGLIEAGRSLGLSSWQVKRQIIFPVALRIIIPPLTNNYISLIKNTSLAVAIGFPDFVSVTSTILNQTGRAVQIVLLWFLFYGALSLIVSWLMNRFNKQFAIVGQ